MALSISSTMTAQAPLPVVREARAPPDDCAAYTLFGTIWCFIVPATYYWIGSQMIGRCIFYLPYPGRQAIDSSGEACGTSLFVAFLMGVGLAFVFTIAIIIVLACCVDCWKLMQNDARGVHPELVDAIDDAA